MNLLKSKLDLTRLLPSCKFQEAKWKAISTEPRKRGVSGNN